MISKSKQCSLIIEINLGEAELQRRATPLYKLVDLNQLSV